MSCHRHKKALTDAAGSRWPVDADPLSPALREHLQFCADCQEFLAREQTLFAAIDSAARRVTDINVSPPVISRMQARVARESNPASITWWVYTFASAALILMAFVVQEWKRPRQTPSDEIATVISTQKNNPTATLHNDSAVCSTCAAHNRPLHSETHTLPRRDSRNVEVLVQPEEEANLIRFYEVMQSMPYPASVVAAQQNNVPLKPMEIAPIEIARLQMANSLEGGDVSR